MADGVTIEGRDVGEGRDVPFPPHHPWDRTFFLVLVGLIWLVMFAGFGFDATNHIAKHGFDYPPIVHVHAAVFVGWLVLVTVQLFLIRKGDYRTHMRLGWLALVLVPLMLVLGPATALYVDRVNYARLDPTTPSFMSTQFTNVIGSSVLILGGVLMRRHAAAHKRLMLMGTVALTEPGFGRLIEDPLYHLLRDGIWPYMVETYVGTWALIILFAGYDLITRKRLHPAFVAAVVWCLANESLAAWLYYQPGWAVFTRHLLGH